jgi:hypothetical protein
MAAKTVRFAQASDLGPPPGQNPKTTPRVPWQSSSGHIKITMILDWINPKS